MPECIALYDLLILFCLVSAWSLALLLVWVQFRGSQTSVSWHSNYSNDNTSSSSPFLLRSAHSPHDRRPYG